MVIVLYVNKFHYIWEKVKEVVKRECLLIGFKHRNASVSDGRTFCNNKCASIPLEVFR